MWRSAAVCFCFPRCCCARLVRVGCSWSRLARHDIVFHLFLLLSLLVLLPRSDRVCICKTLVACSFEVGCLNFCVRRCVRVPVRALLLLLSLRFISVCGSRLLAGISSSPYQDNLHLARQLRWAARVLMPRDNAEVWHGMTYIRVGCEVSCATRREALVRSRPQDSPLLQLYMPFPRINATAAANVPGWHDGCIPTLSLAGAVAGPLP